MYGKIVTVSMMWAEMIYRGLYGNNILFYNKFLSLLFTWFPKLSKSSKMIMLCQQEVPKGQWFLDRMNYEMNWDQHVIWQSN